MSSLELTDITSVRQFMQKTTNESILDPDLEVLILQASEAIERYCNRQFLREGSATKSFEFLPSTNGWDVVDMKPYEARTVTEVKLDADLKAGGVVLASTYYRLGPYPSRDGTFFILRLAELPEPPSVTGLKEPLPFQTRRVDVTGEWGLANIPGDVQKAANVTVESWCHLRRDPGMGQNVEFGEGPPVRGYDLPPSVAFALRRWVRPTAEA